MSETAMYRRKCIAMYRCWGMLRHALWVCWGKQAKKSWNKFPSTAKTSDRESWIMDKNGETAIQQTLKQYGKT